jgi:hypothetical protein
MQMKCITFGTIKSTSQNLTSKDGGDEWVSIIVNEPKKNHKMHTFVIGQRKQLHCLLGT